MPTIDRHIGICGAGLAGALLAVYLGRRGYRVTLYERRADPRRTGVAGGRSINLALSKRGITALERVGLAEKVLADAVPMRGRMMHGTDGTLTFQPYSKNEGESIQSVSRGLLNLTLIDAADAMENVTIEFGWRCVDVDPDAPAAMLEHQETGGEMRAECDVLVGADGAYSAVRGRLMKTEGFDYAQQYLPHGYKELTIPPDANGDFAMEANALHIWPRGGFMMIALPNADRSFTCTCFWPMEGPNGFDGLESDQQITARFRERFGDAVPLITALTDDFRRNPIGRLVTVRCEPWHYGTSVVLLGDAAHAIVPFYGQGINSGFEDVRILDELLEQHDDDWSATLPAFSQSRKPNADAIADLALQNFIEMRDKVGSPMFLFWKKTEKLLHKVLPGWFTPLYTRVTFTNEPYAQARATARFRLRVLGVVVAIVVLILFDLLWNLIT